MTRWFDIIDRDIEPYPDPDPFGTHNLECGYNAINWEGGLVFDGSGTFHGQLRVGHYAAEEYIIDATYDFDVIISPKPCSDWLETECELHDCWWWNGSCHDDQPKECGDLKNKSDCERWYCKWWNRICHGYDPPTCEDLDNQTDCELYKCYWYDGSCHTKKQQPEICDWIDAQGGPSALTPTLVVEIINSYIYGTSPSGYTFIPTVKQAV
ncbi:unnamed protein product, partial [marine sediment metagenome]